MGEIIIDNGDGETQSITGNIEQWESAADVVEAHGWNPDEVEYVVNDPQAEFESTIKDASNLQELKKALSGETGNAPSQARRND